MLMMLFLPVDIADSLTHEWRRLNAVSTLGAKAADLRSNYEAEIGFKSVCESAEAMLALAAT